jgi:hypothetical protein
VVVGEGDVVVVVGLVVVVVGLVVELVVVVEEVVDVGAGGQPGDVVGVLGLPSNVGCPPAVRPAQGDATPVGVGRNADVVECAPDVGAAVAPVEGAGSEPVAPVRYMWWCPE